MSSTKIIALTMVLAGITGYYLDVQGKLQPILSTLMAPAETKGQLNLATLGISLMALIIAISFMSDRTGTWFVLLIVLGALLVNERQQGYEGSLIYQLFNLNPITVPTQIPIR